MTSTHHSLNYHLIFATKERRSLIADSWRERLYNYLGGILRRSRGIAHEIGGIADHVHILAGLNPAHRLSDVLRELKSCSSYWIHRDVGFPLFYWQDGYSAFTVGASDLEKVQRYIRMQKQHHKVRTFLEEYKELLGEHWVDFDEKYFL